MDTQLFVVLVDGNVVAQGLELEAARTLAAECGGQCLSERTIMARQAVVGGLSSLDLDAAPDPKCLTIQRPAAWVAAQKALLGFQQSRGQDRLAWLYHAAAALLKVELAKPGLLTRLDENNEVVARLDAVNSIWTWYFQVRQLAAPAGWRLEQDEAGLTVSRQQYAVALAGWLSTRQVLPAYQELVVRELLAR